MADEKPTMTPEERLEALIRETLATSKLTGANVDAMRGEVQRHGVTMADFGQTMADFGRRIETLENQVTAGVHLALDADIPVDVQPTEHPAMLPPARAPQMSLTSEVRAAIPSIRVAAEAAADETVKQTPMLKAALAQNEQILAQNERQTSMLEGISASFAETGQKIIGQSLAIGLAVFIAMLVHDCKGSTQAPIELPPIGSTNVSGHRG